MAELDLHSHKPVKLEDFLHEHGPGSRAEDVKWPHFNSSLSFFERTRDSFRERSPQIKEAVQNTSSEILQWMHEGGPWRAFLVTTVGVVLLLGLAGLGAFMLFFLVATLNAVVIGLLGSVASVGAFTAFFFTSLIAIYVGALVVAVLSISTITFFCVCAALVVAGWIAFLWVLWKGCKKGVEICKASPFLPIASFRTETSGRPDPIPHVYALSDVARES